VRRIDVGGPAPYPVFIASSYRGLAERLPGSVILVTDGNVDPRWGGVVREALGPRCRSTVVLPAGEAHKTVATWASCVESVVNAGADRDTWVLALGGGVVGDLAGFAAATALRGLPWAVLPTTLLAMVDASIGGKTAVNLPMGKNLVGAFYPPRLVWMATETLTTLPGRELRCGWGEVLKTALIGDPALLDQLDHTFDERGSFDPPLLEVVERCAAIKARIVTEDPYERGCRVQLNLGHTVAHALEASTGGALAHGEAVAIGLIIEAEWAVSLGVCLDPGLPPRLRALAQRMGLPTVPPSIAEDRLLAAARVDKKGAADMIRLPLPQRPGTVIVVDLPRSRVSELLSELAAPAARPGFP
jgi:3-dehydroquinate synthase